MEKGCKTLVLQICLSNFKVQFKRTVQLEPRRNGSNMSMGRSTNKANGNANKLRACTYGALLIGRPEARAASGFGTKANALERRNARAPIETNHKANLGDKRDERVASAICNLQFEPTFSVYATLKQQVSVGNRPLSKHTRLTEQQWFSNESNLGRGTRSGSKAAKADSEEERVADTMFRRMTTLRTLLFLRCFIILRVEPARANEQK